MRSYACFMQHMFQCEDGLSMPQCSILGTVQVHKADPRFPIGRTRLETVGVVSCAVIMTLSTLEVVQTSIMDLWDGFHGELLARHHAQQNAVFMPSKGCVIPSLAEYCCSDLSSRAPGISTRAGAEKLACH